MIRALIMMPVVTLLVLFEWRVLFQNSEQRHTRMPQLVLQKMVGPQFWGKDLD